MLECVQEPSCTLRLQLQLIDFQPGTTSTKPDATGLKPTRVLGAPAVGGGEASNKTSARRREVVLVTNGAVTLQSMRSSEFFLFVRTSHFKLFTPADHSSLVSAPSILPVGHRGDRSIRGERSKAEKGEATPGTETSIQSFDRVVHVAGGKVTGVENGDGEGAVVRGRGQGRGKR